MKAFTARAQIGASLSTVWSVLSDVPSWPSWTPTVTRAEPGGPLGLGASVTLVQPRLKPGIWTVVEWEPQRSFTWVSRGPGCRIVATHALSAAGGGTQLALGIAFEGLLSPVFAKFWGGLSERYIQEEAACLKRHCERLAHPRAQAVSEPTLASAPLP